LRSLPHITGKLSIIPLASLVALRLCQPDHPRNAAPPTTLIVRMIVFILTSNFRVIEKTMLTVATKATATWSTNMASIEKPPETTKNLPKCELLKF
jgi:hypothetical protein